MSFKIATWNVNSLRVRLPQVLEWLAKAKPDVLAIQETKTPDEAFSLAEIHQAGYQAVFSGQPTYNGVAILSRVEGLDVIKNFPKYDDPQKRMIAATIGSCRIVNLYVPNGESTDSPKYQYKLTWLEQLHQFLKAEMKAHPNLVILGDFNIAPEDRDVHDPVEWEGKVLCSEPEREALQKILSLGFQDCFRLKDQAEKSFSWWDYRMNNFKRNRGLRIDHIFASPEMATHCTASQIDKEPRAFERPSDHTPVIAEFSL